MIKISIEINSKAFKAELYDNETAKAFTKILPLTINMEELNGNEKYYNLETKFPTKTENIGKIEKGDIMLWGNNCLVIFYESFNTSYSYTRLGKIIETTGLGNVVGNSNATVTFSSVE